MKENPQKSNFSKLLISRLVKFSNFSKFSALTICEG